MSERRGERRWEDRSRRYGPGGDSDHQAWTLEDEIGTVALVERARALDRWHVYLPHHREDSHVLTFQGTEEEAKGFALHVIAWYERDQRPRTVTMQVNLHAADLAPMVEQAVRREVAALEPAPELAQLLEVVRSIVEAGSSRDAERQLVDLAEAFEAWQQRQEEGH